MSLNQPLLLSSAPMYTKCSSLKRLIHPNKWLFRVQRFRDARYMDKRRLKGLPVVPRVRKSWKSVKCIARLGLASTIFGGFAPVKGIN
jgi:hypothetical protein